MSFLRKKSSLYGRIGWWERKGMWRIQMCDLKSGRPIDMAPILEVRPFKLSPRLKIRSKKPNTYVQIRSVVQDRQ